MTNIAYISKIDPQQAAPASSSTIPPDMLGDSAAMSMLIQTIQRVARSSMTVLINGETGSGKELAARALHCRSSRAHKPFIAINTAAIPKDLLESELFGHERGAFTGAYSRRAGRFEQADGGTLFLDEIGDMPTDLQTRLLRVLADGMFYRVGAISPTKVDVRIITATHQNLEERVADGRFREDLFHRLNVIRIRVPPLRERREDIPLLLTHYLQKAGVAINESPKQLTPEAENHLCAFHWPGNVRQLENVCHWLALMATETRIRIADLPPELMDMQTAVKSNQWQDALHEWTELQLKTGKNNLAKEAEITFESVLIRSAMELSNGCRSLAAKRLGYGRNTLSRKIEELHLFSDH